LTNPPGEQGETGPLAELQRLQEELTRAQKALAEETVEASAGGGAVRVWMSGTQQCRRVAIDPDFIQQTDPDTLQDLLVLAINQAIHDSQVLAARRLGPLAGGMGGEETNS
jgi:DNA-binding YbaB/EbfC family protein